jgi:hypothetical protein
MVPQSDSARHAARRQRTSTVGALLYRVGRVVLVAVLFVLFLLLGQDMLRHRFFQGSRYHANGSLGQ